MPHRCRLTHRELRIQACTPLNGDALEALLDERSHSGGRKGHTALARGRLLWHACTTRTDAGGFVKMKRMMPWAGSLQKRVTLGAYCIDNGCTMVGSRAAQYGAPAP